jgi:nucleoside-diphosphate-sugar epimerase
MPRRNWNKVFVTGGTSFVGMRAVTALVNAGADVTVLVAPDNEEKLGVLRRHVRMVAGDVWTIASLKGRSRSHGVVVHLVGSLRVQPERGLTYQQMNLVSARNVISMAVSDGVPYFILLSAASNPPGASREYLRSKREAEEYLRNSGLRYAVIRAPVLFDREQPGGHFFAALSRIGALPFLRVFFGRRAPLPVDIAAQGISRAALQIELPRNRVLYAGDLRRFERLAMKEKRRPKPVRVPGFGPVADISDDWPEDEVPFGWLPPKLPPDDE